MNRSVATCEDCAYIAAQQRGLPVPERLHPPTGDRPPLERVDVDTLVDAGGNVAVLVAAGDPVLAELAGKPRRPRETKCRRK